ncbi:unnamed protein product [Cunninghamella blakesleeana]
MYNIPAEVFLIIFKYVTQRTLFVCSRLCKQWYKFINQPSLYSTIEFQSEEQFKRFLWLANSKTIHSRRVSFYVHHINFTCSYIFDNEQAVTVILDMFPNIQSINNLAEYTTFSPHVSAINSLPTPHQLSHFSRWFINSNGSWMITLLDNSTKNHIEIKSLDFEITTQMIHFNDNNNSSLPTIRIETPIDQNAQQLNSDLDFFVSGILYTARVIIIPVLNHLTYLKIETGDVFNTEGIENLIFNERTFEYIHQSCPQLRSLALIFFHMTVSNNLDTMILSDTFQPAYQLKELEMEGLLFDYKCYTYLSYKYPHLESLDLHLNSTIISRSRVSPYSLAIHNMLDHLQFLKKLKIGLFTSDVNMEDSDIDDSDVSDEVDVDFENIDSDNNDSDNDESNNDDSDHDIVDNDSIDTDNDDNEIGREVFWPNDEFLQWFLQNPNQLSTLKYENKMIEKLNKNNELYVIQMKHQTIKDIYSDTIFNIIQPNILLNHLSNLSLSSMLITDILYNYLLLNTHTIVLSNTIKELEIDGNTSMNQNYLYIIDWMITIPNLESLKIHKSRIINDINVINIYDSIKNDDDIYNSNNNINNTTTKVHKLHELIANRKQNNKNNSVFKLKNLYFQECDICIKKNNIINFLKKCHQLNSLQVVGMKYLSMKSVEEEILYFNLPHLSLDLLNISSLRFISLSATSINSNIATKLTIYESAINNHSTVHTENSLYKNHSSVTLQLICKYIDKLVFE